MNFKTEADILNKIIQDMKAVGYKVTALDFAVSGNFVLTFVNVEKKIKFIVTGADKID